MEDDAQLRQLIARILRRSGYRVEEAGSGEEAMARIRHLGEAVDLVLTDVVMPGMNGRELVSALRRHPALKAIFMSGYTEDVAVRNGLEPGTYLQKPFTPVVLAEQVRQALLGR